MMASEWHDWHDFYMLLGTASAALVALLFVAVSIGASFLTPERSVATRTYCFSWRSISAMLGI
jgi:hypothetical protein